MKTLFKHSLFFILASLGLLGAACENDPNATSGDGQNSSEGSGVFTLLRNENPLAIEGQGDNFKVLQRMCKEALGEFRLDQGGCDCGVGRIFSFTAGRGLCLPFEENLLSVTPNLRYAQGMSGLAHLTVLLEPEHGQTLSQPEVRQLIEGTVNPAFRVADRVVDQQAIFLSAVNRLPTLLSDFDQSPAFDASTPLSASIQSDIHEALAWVRATAVPSLGTAEGLFDAGCARACEQKRATTLASGRTIQFTRLISFGGNLVTRLSIFDREGHFELLLKLTPANQLSYVVRNRLTAEEEAAFQAPSYEVFSARLVSVGTFQMSDEEFARLRTLRSGHLENLTQVARPQAVVCETGIHGGTPPGVERLNFGIGPHSEHSLFGWTSSRRDRFDTARNSDLETGIPVWLGRALATPEVMNTYSHANGVLKCLREQAGEAGIVILPLVTTSCIASEDTWLTAVREHSKARVVNLSFTTPSMSARSDLLPLVQRIRETRDSFLWVAAAANRGLNLDRMADMSDAPLPQILTEEPNLIKVAQGSAREGLAALSNYGPRSVDLAAPSPDLTGTSFSAPRVTGLAAQIQFKFPDLTPHQVKKAILFSVDWPLDQPLKVSSGGEMNPTRALSMATRLAQTPGLSDLDWILQTYCENTASKPCPEAQKRIRYWRRTLLLPSAPSANARRLK